MTAPNTSIDVDDLVRRYIAGESEKALAELFGVSRTPIRRMLLNAGVEIRGRSAAMYQRMAATSPDERARLAAAAHDAVRGKPKTPDFLRARAAGVERQGASHGNASAAEVGFGEMLRDAGRPVIHQKAIGPYNVDLAAGSVAVEILGGGWHRSKRHGERLRYILDGGWDVIYIWVGRRFPLGSGAAQYVISHCEIRDGDPTAPRCYRVIRGGGEFLAGGRADDDDIPDVIPNSNRPDVGTTEVLPGFCHCGCGARTNLARQNNTALGWVRGQPVRFISGHNAVSRRRDPR